MGLSDKEKDVVLHIETNYAETIKEIEKLTKDLAQLDVEMGKVRQDQKDGKKTTEEANRALEALEAEYRNVQSEIRANRKELQNGAKAYKEAEGSIKQMRMELSNMRKSYESMGKAERESDIGKALLKNIADTTDELKKLEKQQGDYRREVGHYENALNNLDPKLALIVKEFKNLSGGTMNFSTAMKNAVPMLKSFGKELWMLAKNPFVITITTIIVLMKQVADQFRKSDDAITALQQLFASFQPILDVFVGTLDAVVKVLTKVISGFTSAVTAVMSLIPAFKESSEAAQEYVRAMDDLEEKERKYSVQTAKNNIEIARARNKAARADMYSVEERRDATKEAIRLEKENLQMNLEVAAEKLRLAEQDAARRHDTSDETKNNIAELKRAYFQAIADTEAGMRRLNSQMAKFNADIRKDTINTWKTIIGNSAFTTAEWKKADAEYKKMADALEKKAKTWFKMAADSAAAGDEALAEQQKTQAEQYQKEAEDERRNQRTEHKKYLDALKNLSESYYSNQLSARRAYEDAVLEMMDDSLEKQLQSIENQYKREIEDLEHKLKTEEHLTVEARDYINKLIVEKQKQYDRQRTLTEAAYWSNVREQAREAINEIVSMNTKILNADPNRYVGSFAAAMVQEMRGVTDELETTSNMLLDKFKSQYAALRTTIERTLSNGAKGMSDNVVKMFSAIVNETDEFSNNATKSLDSFMLAFETMQQRIAMTPEEFNEMKEVVKPMLDNIFDYYKVLADMPSRYMEYMSNLMFNKMKIDAEKVRDNMLKAFDFVSFTDAKIQAFGVELDRIDKILASKTDAWRYRIENGIGFAIDNPLEIKTGFEFEDPKLEVDGILEETQKEVDKHPIQVKWGIATEDPQLEKKFEELGEKYGNEIDTSMSGVLRQISGFDDLGQQLDWLVRNYETAVNKVNEMANDMRDAYQISGDEAFYMAIPDTSTILQALRRIYDSYFDYAQRGFDYEKARLEVEGKYVGEVDGELKRQIELTALDKRRYEEQERTAKAQLDYVKNVREEVANLKGEYNRVNAENSAQISMLETQLQILHDEQATWDENTTQEVKDQNFIQSERIQAEIEQLRSQIQKALSDLVATGFTSVNEVDEMVGNLEKSVLTAQNGIIQTTAQQTANYTDLWMKSFTRVTNGLGELGGAFNSLFTELGQLNSEYDKFAELSAYFNIGIAMAQGIAEAVAAGAGVPFPANLGAIAAGVASVVAGVGQAISVFNQYHAPKYADGGLIGGRYAKTRAEGRRDDVNIKASKGEYIVNADAVKKYGVEFLDLLNYGKSMKLKLPKLKYADGGYVSTSTIDAANNQMNMDATREMLVEAMSEISPVVSVVEVTKAQNRVKIAERNSKR